MDLAEIEATLAEALTLRSPRFDRDRPSREKIAALEDYLLLSANVNGALVEARHWLRLLEDQLADAWEHLAGWEIGLGRIPRGKATKADIVDAKRKYAPAQFDAGRKARQLRLSIEEQIVRLRFEEEKVVSRAYTMLAG